MNQKNKFLFDLNNFDATDVAEEEIIEEEIEDAPPPPPTFSEDDLEAAKAVAHSAGVNEGIQEERGRREEKVKDLLENIADNFSSLFAAEQYRERQYEEEAVKLALKTLDKIFPSLSPSLGTETLQSVITQNLKKQAEQSEITIEIHSSDISDVEKIIATIWKDPDNAPRCKVIDNDAIEAGACKLSWVDGGLIRNPDKTAQSIRDELQSLLTKQVNNAINKEEDSNSSINGDSND